MGLSTEVRTISEKLVLGWLILCVNHSENILGLSEFTYLGRRSLRRGCAGVHVNNHIPNCRRLSLAILRTGDSQLKPLPVPPSEAVDVWAAHPSEFLLQHGEPGLQLTTPLPAPVRKRHWVDDVPSEFEHSRRLK